MLHAAIDSTEKSVFLTHSMFGIWCPWAFEHDRNKNQEQNNNNNKNFTKTDNIFRDEN